MIKAGVYTRISSDPSHERLGVERQRQDCEELAKRRGWQVAEVFEDDDRSAFSGKPRPAYLRLLEAITQGRIGAVIAWHSDRLHRSPRELETFIDLVERTGTMVETVKAGTVDLSTPSGRAVARTLGAWARFESEHKSDRIRRKLAQNAATGKPHGGVRAYGYEPGRRVVREAEATVIREAVERVLAGEPIRAVFRSLNERGLFNAGGKPWTHNTLRGVLLGPRIAGLRVHRGQVVGEGDWPAIIPVETFRALERLLSDPGRVTTPGRGGRLHLLSGLVTCKTCGQPIRVGKSKGVDQYRCYATHVTRSRELLDAYVSAHVVERLSRPDAVDLLSPPDDGGERRRAGQEAERVRERLDAAAASFAAGEISDRQLAIVTAKLRPVLAELEAAAAPPPERARMFGGVVDAGDVQAAWDALPIDRKRAIIAELLTIRLSRGRRGPQFSPEGIEIAWKS